MPPLSSETSLLEELGAVHTANEINAQPDLWMEIYGQISADREKIASFLSRSLPGTSRIILTGAGTSAFIGLSLTPLFNRISRSILILLQQLTCFPILKII